jgi:hypothetical protein
MLTLGQAARLTGKGKTTLTRAIKAGRLSATRTEDGMYAIDPSELARAYDVTPEGAPAVHHATPVDSETATRLAVAEAELRSARDMIAELQQARDDWKAQAERLALTAPIIAPAPAPVPAPAPESRRRWFGWRAAG